MQDNRLEQPPARQAIWSIPGHLGRWYGGIFAFQYLVFLGLTIWDEVVYRTGDNAVQNILAVQRGMTANILNIAASAYVILEGVMLAQWLKERDQRKQREALEQAREEAQEERKKNARNGLPGMNAGRTPSAKAAPLTNHRPPRRRTGTGSD